MYGEHSDAILGFFAWKFVAIGFAVEVFTGPTDVFKLSYCGDCLLIKLIPDIFTMGLLTLNTIFWFYAVVGGGIKLGLLF